MGWTPALFLPAPFCLNPFQPPLPQAFAALSFPFADRRLTPQYPAPSPLDDVLRRVVPGSDEYITEKYAMEIMRHLDEWSQALRSASPGIGAVAKFLDASIEASSLLPIETVPLPSRSGIEVVRRRFATKTGSGRERFLQEIRTYLSSLGRVETAEFQIVGMEEIAGNGPSVRADIRYDLVGALSQAGREERVGLWHTQWLRSKSGEWSAVRWEGTEETLSRASAPVFIDVTAQALGGIASYKSQMLRGTDYWRTILDGACGIDVYGNNGVAAGDIDNDGLDDLYVCQPAGLPNRLYRNRGDGTFEDVTQNSGLDVLDNTACALFADFENKGVQDLLVVCGSGPLLFLNQGKGKFALQPDAFKFEQPPQGMFTHAAIADYDHDGRLDVYFCLYSYYVGLDQYRYPVPYFDARNGPANFLFHNEGNAAFQDRTAAAGLNVDNNRYSFSCAWGDHNGDSWPDLYVANDFGRSNLYRNNGNGTFTVISAEAGVEDVGAGMSACWLDFDNDGNQDVYVANMWSAAGIRVSEQKRFHERDSEEIRALFRQHARGNSLYRNQGNGRFQNLSEAAGVAMGRWAWSSDSWDFDHDGYSDLYIANGYISGPNTPDLGSFFWRQVVAKSPPNATPSTAYEQGWNAINELVRSDSSWSSWERNVLYLNNHDGTFSEVSGTAGLDLPDDSRAFALADIDHDGRLELILKNRTAPQLRILRNVMKEVGNSVAFRLQGQKSNRDAIGTAITVEAAGHDQTKYLQAGSGFLSQHTKELFFGIGDDAKPVRATVRWPSGLTQVFEHLPVNQRIEIQEGVETFVAKPFAPPSPALAAAGSPPEAEPLPARTESWLLEPLAAPEFSLPDLTGKTWELRSSLGGFVLLFFWVAASPACDEQMQAFGKRWSSLGSGLRVVGINVDDPGDAQAAQSFALKQSLPFPTLLATPEVAGIYNLVYRYLFDRRRDLPLPASFLLDEDGFIVKIYQGQVDPERLLEDVRSVPRTLEARMQRALPFGGTLHQSQFQRNDFTYGVAFFQRGYLDQAAASFKQVIAAKPDDPDAYYNLGTLYVQRNDLSDARRYLEQAVKLRPNYPEAWNNLGMIAAQQGEAADAVRNFQQSLFLRPDYVTAMVNLGNLYRRQRAFDDAEQLLSRALKIEPDNPETNYSTGMLYAQRDQIDKAADYLGRALTFRPEYPDALNNLGVLLIREQRYAEAEPQFLTCIRVAPNFDQAYLNLARLYVILNDKAKAREVLLALLRQQPQHKMAQQALEMLQ